MQLRYHDDFVEDAVFACANNRIHTGVPELQLRRFHRERERLYSILDPDDRNAAFFKLHLEWFREWGLEKMLLDLVDEFPLLRGSLTTLAFHTSRTKQDEGAELFVRADQGRNAVMALRVERFKEPDELASFLRHELTHVHDMLAPAFGYSPQLHLPGQNIAQQRLTRERYRLLWDITIDGRITHAHHTAVAGRQQHREIFDRAFGFWPEARRDDVFSSLWLDPQPRHGSLLAIASDPRDLKSAHEPTPGAPCPLCGFPTFDWVDAGKFCGQIIDKIQREFPQWTPQQAACGRCLAIYRQVVASSLATA